MWEDFKNLFGNSERRQPKANQTPDVLKTFTDTAATFKGRPNPFESMQPTTEETEAGREAQLREARKVAERVAAQAKLAEAKGQEWPDVAEPTEETGAWVNKKAE